MRILRGHKGAVTGLAFSPDGRQLVSSSRDSTVRVWELAGREVRRMDAPWPALCVAWSPDSTRLAAGYEAGAVQRWESPSWDRPTREPPHDSPCHSIAFLSPDSFVSAGSNRVRVHHVTESREYFRQPGIEIDRLDLDAKKRPVIILRNGRVERLAPELGRMTSLTQGFVSGEHSALRTSPFSPGIAFAHDRFIGLWDGNTRQLPRTWNASNERIAALAFHVDGESLLSAGLDGLVKHWELADFTALSVHDFGVGECYSLAVSPDGLLAAVGGMEDIVVWDLGG